MNDVLDQLSRLLRERKESGDPDSSYVARLHARGLNKILEKVGETGESSNNNIETVKRRQMFVP